MDTHLISSRHNLEGDDPIFRINALAQSRKSQGHPVVNLSIGALLDDEGQLVTLRTVIDAWSSLVPMEIHPYAPILGDPEFIEAITHHYWRQAPQLFWAAQLRVLRELSSSVFEIYSSPVRPSSPLIPAGLLMKRLHLKIESNWKKFHTPLEMTRPLWLSLNLSWKTS